MDTLTDSATHALHALLSAHVWEDEHDDEVLYINRHGLTTPQVIAIVREWYRMQGDPLADAVTVYRWTEIESVDLADESKVYATRVMVSHPSCTPA